MVTGGREFSRAAASSIPFSDSVGQADWEARYLVYAHACYRRRPQWKKPLCRKPRPRSFAARLHRHGASGRRRNGGPHRPAPPGSPGALGYRRRAARNRRRSRVSSPRQRFPAPRLPHAVVKQSLCGARAGRRLPGIRRPRRNCTPGARLGWHSPCPRDERSRVRHRSRIPHRTPLPRPARPREPGGRARRGLRLAPGGRYPGRDQGRPRVIRKSLLMILLAAAASAAGLSVRIVDTQGRAIPGATVSLISRGGESKTLTADAEGGCEFLQAADGDYFVQAGAPGFAASAPRAVRLPTGDDAAMVISLGLAQVRSEVVVTASGTPQSTDEVSKALTVVDRGAMELRADPTVADALLDVPGLSVQQLGGPLSTTYFKTRGLRDTDTAVLVDGLRLRDAAGTQADASGMLQDLVIADTGRIEVLRGAGSSLYGTDAIGGVVNIVTDEGGGRTHGSLSLDGGGLGAARAAAQLAGGIHNDRLQYSAGLTHWNVTRGVDDNSPARNTSGHGQATVRLSRIAWLTARVYAGDSFGFIRQSPVAIGNLPASGAVDAVSLPLAQQHLYEAGKPYTAGQANFIADAFDPDSTRNGKFFTGALRFAVRPSDRFGFTAQYQNVRSTRNYGDGPAGPGDFQPTGSNLSSYLGRIQTAGARVDYS